MTEIEFERVWKEFYPKVYGYFFRRIENREDCEDLVGLTMSSFFKNLQEKTVESPHALVWKIARFKLIDYFRQHKINVSDLNEFLVIADEKDPYETFRSRHYSYSINALMDCISKISSQEEFTLVKKIYIQEKQTCDIADEIGMKPATLRKKMSRLLTKIRESCRSIWKEYVFKL